MAEILTRWTETQRGLVRLTAPAYLPITVAYAKQHLRLETSTDDTYVGNLLAVATQHVENVTRRALYKQKWRLTLDRFPAAYSPYWEPFFYIYSRGTIDLVKPPILSVDSIHYIDMDGSDNIVDASTYIVDIQDAYCRIQPQWDLGWPLLSYFRLAAVYIDHFSGYTDGVLGNSPAAEGDPANKIPWPIKQAILMVMNDLYENREQTVIGQGGGYRLPFGIDDLLAPYRSIRF